MEFKIGSLWKNRGTIIKVIKHGDKHPLTGKIISTVKCLESDPRHGWIVGKTYEYIPLDKWARRGVFKKLNIDIGQIYHSGKTLIKITNIDDVVNFDILEGFYISVSTTISNILSNFDLIEGQTCSCGLPARWINAKDRGKYCWSCYGT